MQVITAALENFNVGPLEFPSFTGKFKPAATFFSHEVAVRDEKIITFFFLSSWGIMKLALQKMGGQIPAKSS